MKKTTIEQLRLFAPVLLFAAFSANCGLLYYTFCSRTGGGIPYLISLLPLAVISFLLAVLVMQAGPHPAEKKAVRNKALLTAALHAGVLTAGTAGVLSVFFDRPFSVTAALACGYLFVLTQLGILLYRMRKTYRLLLVATVGILLVTILSQTLLTYVLFCCRDVLFG